ncbi:MAG TPA: DUF6766 family protein [Candidatus Nitrosocosmicus sp.]|nr:DUF6766 family protein [Candidatus Nitrosocosmicus sp.]
MKHKLREYGLSITLLGLFFVIQVGLSLVGQRQYNHEQADHGQPTVSYLEYVRGPAFLEATMENWESEFLQMFAYVLLTAFLFQKGSAESKDPEKQEAVDRDPRQSRDVENAPWPVRKGGIVLKLYENSLSIALFLLFAIAFVLHAVGGAKVYSQQQTAHGEQAVTVVQYLGTAQFWFESLQNWQSEFFSIGILVLLSIFLRQKGSPESKPVDSPHSMTGHE